MSNQTENQTHRPQMQVAIVGQDGTEQTPGSATDGASITPGAGVIGPFRALFVGTSGDVTAQMWPSGTSLTFTNAPVGLLPIQFNKITAGPAGLVGLK